MKNKLIATLAFSLLTFAAVSTVLAITQDQARVIPVLKTLKLEAIPSKLIGGPQKYKVTKETIELLQDALDEGKVIVLQNDGSIAIEKK
jgi:hypothetical protein